VGHRIGLDDKEKGIFLILLGLKLRLLDLPACSQLLYELNYRGSVEPLTNDNIFIASLRSHVHPAYKPAIRRFTHIKISNMVFGLG
jgi:hypothetical protein